MDTLIDQDGSQHDLHTYLTCNRTALRVNIVPTSHRCGVIDHALQFDQLSSQAKHPLCYLRVQ